MTYFEKCTIIMESKYGTNFDTENWPKDHKGVNLIKSL